MFLGELNWIAIVVLSLLWTIFGAFWYSPKAFGGKWAALNGMNANEMKGKLVPGFITEFITAVLAVAVLALFLALLGTKTFVGGALIAFLAWLGFVVTSLFSPVIWQSRSFVAFLIDAFYTLIALVIVGGVLAIW